MPDIPISTRTELAGYIRTYGALDAYERVKIGASQIKHALEHGEPLHAWRTLQGAGALVFFQVDTSIPEGQPRPAIPGTMLLCVNAPDSARDFWERIAAENSSDTLVIMNAFRPFLPPQDDEPEAAAELDWQDESEIPF